MGVWRGSSIKMWRAFLPYAKIYGADVRRELLLGNYYWEIPQLAYLNDRENNRSVVVRHKKGNFF